MALKVQFYPPTNAPQLELLYALLDDSIEINYAKELPVTPDFDIIIHHKPSRDDLMASPNLRAVITPYVGPHPDTVEVLSKELTHVTLHSLPYNVGPTAETALALMFAAAKFIVVGDQGMRKNDWSLRYSDRPQVVLAGKTVLILGYGRIGRIMAPVCHALNMNVIGVRRTLQESDSEDAFATVHDGRDLARLLPQADVLISTLPAVESTEGLIGAEEIGLLPDGAIIVNVGRGPVIDEMALYEGLQSGKLAGAGIDVWYNYPWTPEARTNTAPSKHPFHELPNVVMSPHRAGWLGEADGGRMAMLAEMLNAAAAGKPIPNPINVALGY